jgi:pseudaminic acid biosynthesis-associated methylase
VSERRDYRTPQEAFWAGEFGTTYIARNAGDDLLASNLHFFSVALRSAGPVRSCLEIGANIGMNLKALRLLYPGLVTRAVEINPEAARVLGDVIGAENVRTGSIFDEGLTDVADLVLVKGFLIHISPDMLPLAYERIYQASGRWILIAEYYNPSPVAIPYRGHADRLFKRDFAGELLDRYPQLALVDYGFVYRRDPAFPQDDVTWFLLERKA